MAVSLKAHRVNLNMTLKEAADKLGVTIQTLSSWENGKTYPDVIQIKKIEKEYGVRYDDIIFLTND